jgi:GH24 family phage-related lysozyme (muramidase)
MKISFSHTNVKNSSFKQQNQIKKDDELIFEEKKSPKKHDLNSSVVGKCLSAIFLFGLSSGCSITSQPNKANFNKSETDSSAIVEKEESPKIPEVSADSIKAEKEDLLKINELTEKEYNSKRSSFIINLENGKELNDKSEELHAFDDGASIGIGYGLDLLHNSPQEINNALRPIHMSLSRSDEAIIGRLGHLAVRQGEQGADARKEIIRNLSLHLGSEENAKKVLNYEIDFVSEKRVEDHVDKKLPKSKERLALLSMLYNSDPDIITDDLNKALSQGNRFKAWYEIRYNSNTHKEAIKNGIASRRYQEADMFGLFNKSYSTKTEAKTFLDFLGSKDPTSNVSNYRIIDSIRDYEKRYNPEDSQSETIDETVKSLKSIHKLNEEKYDLK